MTTLGVGSFNTVMGENRNAENDAILNNANNLLNYHADQKSDKLIEEGENEKIGATDAGAATSAISNAARFAVRKSESGKTYGQLARDDLGVKTTPSAPAETFNTIQTSGDDVPRTAVAGAGETVTVPETTATGGGAATSTPLEAAGESTADATSGAADVGATAAKTTEEIATSTATKVAGKAAFWGGKALGNVGGAIDLVKDIQSSAAGGSFLAGTGKSTTDEVGNGLELAGSVLDVAGIALPFLEPLGAALTIAGGLTSTVGGLTDQTTMENKTTGDYNKGNVSMPVPQGSAGLGFIASAPTNPMKQITGSSTF
tara:strand:- start:2605 stop:3552 length:948 start_codon:yes stop_codon:yes gene_type:complete